jgi:hypothetical protein
MPSHRYQVYSTFSADIKAASVQCAIMDKMYWHNMNNVRNVPLNYFLRSIREKLEANFKIMRMLGTLDTRNKFINLECKRLREDFYIITSELRSGFWRAKITGQPISRIRKFNHLLRIIGFESYLVTHPLFKLINNSGVLFTSPSKFTKALSNSEKRSLLRDKDIENYSFSEIPKVWKQSYRQQRENLMSDVQLDSLLILILMAIYQQSFLGKARPTVPEKMAYILFKKLFCVKYPISSANTIAVKISILLEDFSLNPLVDSKKKNLLLGEQHFDEIFSFYRDSIYKNDKALKFNDEDLIAGLTHLKTLKHSEDINNGFLWLK